MIEIIDGQEQIITSIGSEKRKKLAAKTGIEVVQLNQILHAGSLAKAPPNKTKAEIAAIDAANAKKDSPEVDKLRRDTATKLIDVSKDYNPNSKITIATEDGYLSLHGAFFEANAAFHRHPRGITKTLQKAKDMQVKANQEISKTREALGAEYAEKVKKGELRPPTRNEALVAKAHGHSDNESTQSARRLLSRRGIDYLSASFDEDGNLS